MTTIVHPPPTETQSPPPADAAAHYRKLGLHPVPFPIHDKGPNRRGWQSHAYDLSKDFRTPSNIGLLLGPNGNYLADVDLDSTEAIVLAPHYLPKTNWLSGHKSAPQSHYWYIIDYDPSPNAGSPKPEYHKFTDPQLQLSDTRSTLLELRWGLPDAAHQTVVPPSIHPSHEPYIWYPTGNLPDTLPPIVNGGDLDLTVHKLAAASLLARIWKNLTGSRNDLTMALSGALFRTRGWGLTDVAHFIQSIAAAARDEELPKRLDTIKATYRRHRTPSNPTTGWPEVVNLIGKAPADSIHSWLGLHQPLASMHGEEPFTDLGNAIRLINMFGHDLIYVHTTRTWYYWEKVAWKPDTTQEIHRRANFLIQKLEDHSTIQAVDPNADSTDAYDRDGVPLLRKHARRSASHGKLIAVVARASTLEEVAREPDIFDQDPWALNLANGTLDLKTDELRPHNREDHLTYCLPVRYDPSAECPNWLRFLQQITNDDPELQAYLQRCVGYSLTGSTEERCLFILHGSGANGKSVFIQTVADLLGPYAKRGTTETFLKQRYGNQSTNDLAALSGKRFVQIAEVEEGRNLAEALIKDVTGGERQTARFLYQEFFEFKPTFKLWLSTNHRPIINGTDQAIWDRIRLIPFTMTIPPDDRIPMPELLALHAQEAAGILNWAIEGCTSWYKAGRRLAAPESVTSAVREYRTEMNVIGSWLDERCVRSPGSFCRLSDLYEDYRTWCEQAGEYPGHSRGFSENLRNQHGFEREKRGVVIIKGVRLHES